MKITEQSRERLVIRHTPWFLGGFMWLMGGAALYASAFRQDTFTSTGEAILVPSLGIAMLAGAWWFAPMVTLVFDRAAGRVWFSENRLFHPRTQGFDLSRIERAQLQSNWSDGSRLTRLALRTADGVVPLETGYSSADRTKVMSGVNAWLEGKAPLSSDPPTVRR